MNVTQRSCAALIAAALLLPTLGLRSLWPPDETRYADVARGMLASGDWVVPRTGGETYREKPPLFFWATAAAHAVGVPLGAAPRLVSVVAGVLTVALVPRVASGLGLTAPIGARAAIVLATTPLFLVYAQLALLDALATCLVTGAIAAKLARAGRGGRARSALCGAEGVLLGMALLTKGPVLLLFPLGLRAGAALARASRSHAARADASDLAALGVAIAAALAWLAAAAAGAGGEYARDITFGQVVRRVTGDAPHLRPPGFLLLVLALGFLPWTPFGVLRLGRARPSALRSMDAATAALAGWLFAPLALLSLLETQQPHYALPALPAAALLVAPALEEAPVALRRTLALLGAVAGGLLLVAAFGAGAVVADGAPARASTRALLADLPLRAIVAGTGGALAALALWPRRAGGALWPRAASAAALAFAGIVLVVSRIDPYVAPWALLASPAVRGAERLAADGSLPTSIRVATGRERVEELDGERLLDALAADPGLVAVVRERDLEELGARAARLEVLARGWSRGHVALAVREPRGEGGPAAGPGAGGGAPATRPPASR